MNQELELNIKLENPDILILAGSRMYGTNTPTSDHDYRGFIVPPFEYLAGLNNFEHRVIREPDTVIYSIKKLFQLLIIGDPVACEILFAPKTNIIHCSDVGKLILRNRHLFICKRFARRIKGYAQSEWRKVTGEQLVPIARTATEDTIIEDIRTVFCPNKEEMDEIIRILFMNHPREIRSTTRKLGDKRKKQIEQHGYCTSSACHTIRLLEQLKELMDTSNITFPRQNANQLLQIKNGNTSIEDVKAMYEIAIAEAITAEANTNLPEIPPIKMIQRTYHTIIAHTLINDRRVKSYTSDYYWGKL